MRKVILSILIVFSALVPLSAVSSLSIPFSSVADRGHFENLFSNPAAIPFKESSQGDFLIASGFSDNLDQHLFDIGAVNPFMQNTSLDLLLSFSGKYIAFTALFDNTLKDRTDNAVFTVSSTAHFQIDIGYSLFGVSLGARIKGGNVLWNNNRSITGFISLLENTYFARFDKTNNSQYFSLGMGMMYSHEYFSIGLYSDDVLYLNTDSGNVSSDFSSFLSSFTVALSAEAPRFTSYGDLLLVRPKFTLQAADIRSEKSRFDANLELRFQLLPRFDIFTYLGYSDFRNVFESDYLAPYKRISRFVLRLDYYSFSFTAGISIPFEVYTGGRDEISYSLLFRFLI